MRILLLRARRWRIVWVLLFAATSLGLMASGAIPATYIERREMAQQVWKAQSITSYHIVVRAFFRRAHVRAGDRSARNTALYAARYVQLLMALVANG